eukprot:CAMPEP_0168620178 /NCGR_PEP_ID=MMETSP0449_2-20121227/6995_1 /TAXON_ID=1082188 /ORGANISM="Strombidium rassoulzadegani, Strain ras09" /LENGTH=73 /DNA_ID=CAMNT_0008661159 /DNA_START=103 /DNA_END=324 /DNA_ORIENTATION=+
MAEVVYDEKGTARRGNIFVNFQMAIQNLNDILIDDAKFSEMKKNVFDAIDTDNIGVINVEQVEVFFRAFLRGT